MTAWKTDRNQFNRSKAFVTHLSANCSLKSVCTFKKKNAKESIKVWLACSAIKFIVKMHFKDTKEAAQQKETLFFQVLFTKLKQTSCYDVTVHLRYDVTGQELIDWPETLSWLAVTNTG